MELRKFRYARTDAAELVFLGVPICPGNSSPSNNKQIAHHGIFVYNHDLKKKTVLPLCFLSCEGMAWQYNNHPAVD